MKLSRSGMPLATVLTVAALALADPAAAAVSSYAFATSSQAYVPLAAGTTVIAGTNQAPNPPETYNDAHDGGLRSIGFEFCFDGVTYDQFTAYTGGVLTLGSSTLPDSGTPNSRFANDLAASAAYPVIAPWWDHQHTYDNGGAAAGCSFAPPIGVHYALAGVPPSRTLTVEWNTQVADTADSFWWAGCGATMNRYQAVLHEGTDVVEFRYGSLWASSGQPTAATIGLAAGSANFSSVTPTGATATVSSVTSNNAIAAHLALLPNDTVYAYQPAKGATTTTASGLGAAVFGQRVTITATVTGTGMPGGTVYFLEGTTILSSAPVVGGQASTTLTLPLGGHTILAAYSGDCALAPSSGSMTLAVGAASSLTTVTPPPAVVAVGTSVTFTASVVPVAPGAGVPTGSVTFLLDGAPWQTIPLVGGVASAVSGATLAVGAHTIAASYGGDPNFGASAAAPQSFLVLDPAVVPALSPSGLALFSLLLAAAGLRLLKDPLA